MDKMIVQLKEIYQKNIGKCFLNFNGQMNDLAQSFLSEIDFVKWFPELNNEEYVDKDEIFVHLLYKQDQLDLHRFEDGRWNISGSQLSYDYILMDDKDAFESVLDIFRMIKEMIYHHKMVKLD
jgi:hypothetical protein